MENITFEDSGKLLRILDSCENNPLAAWVNVSGTVPKSTLTPETAIQNIQKKYGQLLKEFPTLRLKIVTMMVSIIINMLKILKFNFKI